MNLYKDIVHSFQILAQNISSIFFAKLEAKQIWIQLHTFANQSLSIVIFCVSFMGIILITEYSFHMKLVLGTDSMIPGFAMIMLTRELAPIVTALLLSSRMGASIAAELAAMKNNEELDAYKLLGLDIVENYVAPRTLASAISCWALSSIALFFSVLGAWLSALVFLNFSTGPFFSALFMFSSSSDFVLMGCKAFVFGIVIPPIAAHFGIMAKPGASGVGHAATNAVVSNSIAIIVLNFLITYIFVLLTN